MPTHHGSRTKVSLVIADLDSTTTKEPENRRGHGEMGKAALERGENTIKNGRNLKESFIPVNGDLNPVHFLGQDGTYMPFMMVRAGKELRQNPAVRPRVFRPDPARNAVFARILGHSSAEAIHSPHALGIRLDISEQSFLKTTQPMEDIKIDVLFNGQFTNATTAPTRTAKDNRAIIFGGKRTHYMLERPWVVLPRDKNADGTQRFAALRTETPQERWKELSQAVAEEANLRTTHMGGCTPVAEYFDALSKLPMPPELDELDERDTHKYSVIDIVLSYGHGGKDGATSPYLCKPTRLRQRLRPTAHAPPPKPRRLEDIPELKEGKEHRSISDVEIRKDKNVITSSQQLPKFLTGAIERAGFQHQTNAEQAGRWATASIMLKDVLDRGLSKGKDATTSRPFAKPPSTPLRDLPPPMSPPRSSLYTQSRLREVMVPSDVQLPPAAPTPSSLVCNTSRMTLDSPSPFVTSTAPTNMPPLPIVTRSGNRYSTVSSGSPHKRRRTGSTSSTLGSSAMGDQSPDGIGISGRGIFTAAGGTTDLSVFQAPMKQFVNPNTLMPPPLSPLKSARDMSFLDTPKPISVLDKPFTRVVLKLGRTHVLTLQLGQPPYRLSSFGNDMIRVRNNRNDLAIMGGNRIKSSSATTPSRANNQPSTPGRRTIRARGVSSRAIDSDNNTTATATPAGPNISNVSPNFPDISSINVPYNSPHKPLYNAPYTLFPNPYTTPALASPFASTGTTAESPASPASTPASTPRSATRASQSHSQSQSASRSRVHGRPRRPKREFTSSITATQRQAEQEASFREFVTPLLSRDAAVSYSAVRPAWQGTQWTQGMERGAGGGVVRQIRTERGGEFKEEGIVVGVRFIVL